MKKQKKLTAIERDQIALLHTQGISNSEVARRLGREMSTIGRELKQNRWGETYVAIHAQQLARESILCCPQQTTIEEPWLYDSKRKVLSIIRRGGQGLRMY